MTWEAQKKNAFETAAREIPHKKIELNEWRQGLTKSMSRSAPSLWSHEVNDVPASVEEAATKYFRREGWIVCPTPFALLSIFGITEALASLENGPEESLEKLLDNSLFYQDVCRILRSSRPSKPEKFVYWLQRVFSQRDRVHELNPFAVLGPIFPKKYANSISSEESNEGEIEFIKKLYHLSPRQTWQTAYLINRERIRKHGSFAGTPDLLIWRDDAYSMVEVKSPNDAIQLSQAFFYCTVIKPLSINFFIADIIPAGAPNR